MNVCAIIAAMRTETTTYLYAIVCEPLSAVKIGITENVQSRLTTLQIGNPAKLRVLWTHPGGEEWENYVHHKLRHARLRGEWFNADDPLVIEFVANPCKYKPCGSQRQMAKSKMRRERFSWGMGQDGKLGWVSQIDTHQSASL